LAVGEGSSLLTDFARAEPLTALVRSAHSRVSWSQSRVRWEDPSPPWTASQGRAISRYCARQRRRGAPSLCASCVATSDLATRAGVPTDDRPRTW